MKKLLIAIISIALGFLVSCKTQTINIASYHAPKRILYAKEFYERRGYRWVKTKPLNDSTVVITFKKRI